jgi:hypothetical protein
MEVSGKLHSQSAFPPPPRERAPFTHWIGIWAGRGGEEKIPSPFRDSNPPIIQPIAQRYTTELSWLIRPSSTQVNNAWSYTSIPPLRLYGVVLS